MLTFCDKNNRFSGQLRDCLKTIGMGLGLVRLQMDAGLTEEARTTLASLQDDFQLLLHAVDRPMESTNSYAGMNADGKRFCDLNEERGRFLRRPFGDRRLHLPAPGPAELLANRPGSSGSSSARGRCSAPPSQKRSTLHAASRGLAVPLL